MRFAARRVRTVLTLALFACTAGEAREPERNVAQAAREAERISADRVIRGSACAVCHADVPAPAAPPSIGLDGARTADADALLALLQPPRDAALPADAHPDFHLDEREAIALLLFLDAPIGSAARTGPARAAHDRHADVTRDDGRRIFVALNCAGCHPAEGAEPRANGPSLAVEGSRVRTDWLAAFLREPRAVRPTGVRAGDGARMPRFALANAAVDSIVAFLTARTVALPEFTPERLSPHATARAQSRLVDRHACLGCHTLDGRGGRIGPDLSAAGARLDPRYIRAMLEQPAQLTPVSIMPATMAPARDLDEMASLLAARAGAPDSVPDRAGYASLFDPGIGEAQRPADSETDALYATWCGACHGDGSGNGFNASNLRAPPADHADAGAMSARTDDRLYDGIAAGAFFLDGSPEMPAFGSRLSPAQIRALVRWIRARCDCREPAWAGDGQREPGASRP